jgi:hypothetical protein
LRGGEEMPETGLRGPYTLNNSTIDEKVTETSAGAYALGLVNSDGAFVPKYVGRSDDDINARLKDWIGKNYSHFKFEYYSSAKAAFEKECDLYHDWKKQLDNEQHPDRSNGTNWKCPRCDVFG